MLGVMEIVNNLCALPSNYRYDSFAIEEIKKLVEISLGEYKEDLKNQEIMKNLMEIINSFVKAGWNEAINLALKLDEIWR
jgi:hypothetical protein